MKPVRTLLLLALTALSGCSWFGGGEPGMKPAELTEFKASVQLTRAWEAGIGGSGAFVFSPASDGEAVYAASAEGRIARYDLATGREVWRVDAGKVLSAGVGVGEGLVLVGTPKGEVLAYRSKDGAAAWTAKLGGEILSAPVAGVGELVAARANDGRVWLLEAQTGKLRWSNTRTLPALTVREQGELALTSQGVVVGYPGGRLALLALGNGAPLWETNVALPKGATELERVADVTGPLALDDRQVCAAAYQGRVACFERVSGNSLWTRDASATRGVDMDERQLYLADDLGAVLAFDKGRGTNTWKQDKLRARKLSTPAAVAGKYVAVGDFQGYVHLLGSDAGEFAARAASDGSAIRGTILTLKSGLVVQTANGGVHAYKIQTP